MNLVPNSELPVESGLETRSDTHRSAANFPEADAQSVGATPFTEAARGSDAPLAPQSGDDEGQGEKERVSKLLSRAGIASRRAAEALIIEGRVSVNGHFIREPGAKADPHRDKILFDGRPIRVASKPTVVVLLHKPKYTITSRADDGKAGDRRAVVLDLMPRKYAGLHPVGRLDYETTGVLLLTDDGELTHLLTHPSHGIEKVYEARVRGEVTASDIETLRGGVSLEDGKTAPCGAKVLAQTEKNALVQLTLREGKNRQVRRMMEALGHPVTSLRRVQFAGIKLEGLPPGEFRVLLPAEIKSLFRAAQTGLKTARKKPRVKGATGRETRVPSPTQAKNLRVGQARARAAEKTPQGREDAKRKAENAQLSPSPMEERFARKAPSSSPRAPIERAPVKPLKKAPAKPRGAAQNIRARNPLPAQAPTARRVEKRWKE